MPIWPAKDLLNSGAALTAANAAQADIDGHEDGGVSKHDATEIDVEGAIPSFPAGGLQAALVAGDVAIVAAQADATTAIADAAAAQADATTALADAAAAQADVDLLEVLALKSIIKSLTVANIQNLHTTPISLVPAPAAGKFNEVVAISYYLPFNTTAHDNAAALGDLLVRYAGGPTIAKHEADGLIDAGADITRHTTLADPNTGGITAFEPLNADIEIVNDGAAFTSAGGGNSGLKITVYYRELDLTF